jgi:PAS domain S-box-containing protein
MKKNEFGGIIAKKLVLSILLFSSLITLLFTSWQLFSDYRLGRNQILVTLQQIEDSHVKTISRTVWTSNKEQLEVQLQGILELNEMQYVKVSFENYVLEAGILKEKNIISRQISLSFTFDGKKHDLGTLQLVATLENLYSHLYDRVFYIFVTQGIKTFLVSIFIFFIFQFMVTRHLSTMAAYAKNLTIENLKIPLTLKERFFKRYKSDELELVTHALNSMRLNLLAEIEKHEKQKEQIKASLKEKETLLYKLEKETIEHKQVENEKKENEEKYKSLAENSQDYIMRYDDQGRHLYQNQAAYRVSGYSKEEFIGKTHEELGFDKKLCDVWGKRITEVFHTGKPSGEIFSWDSEEGMVYLDWRVFPEFDKKGNVKTVLGVSRDISELKQSEAKIRASLKEKETLLHEVHHRVKNNMQVINSLLKLQSNNIEDVKAKEILKDSQSRVYAMSAIHETLHGSENLSEIDLKSYLSRITTSIFQTYSTDYQEIKLNNNVEEVPISLNQAYPIGLTINELISNSLKYAFPNDKKGEISVSMKSLDMEFALIVKDDGIGMPEDFDWKNTKSLGLKLVRTLVENQLDGSIDMESKNGTKFTIKFNIET